MSKSAWFLAGIAVGLLILFLLASRRCAKKGHDHWNLNGCYVVLREVQMVRKMVYKKVYRE